MNMPENKRGEISSRGAAGAILAAFACALVIKLFFFDFMIIEGHSMMPAIRPGSLIIVSKLAYGLRIPGSGRYSLRWRLPRSGEVVIFYTPSGDIAVKRCGKVIDGLSFEALGDNKAVSYDSRAYGPVPVDDIIGKVLGGR
jgi:signal peptidase I